MCIGSEFVNALFSSAFLQYLTKNWKKNSANLFTCCLEQYGFQVEMMIGHPTFIVGRHCVLEYYGYVRPEEYCTVLYWTVPKQVFISMEGYSAVNTQ